MPSRQKRRQTFIISVQYFHISSLYNMVRKGSKVRKYTLQPRGRLVKRLWYGELNFFGEYLLFCRELENNSLNVVFGVYQSFNGSSIFGTCSMFFQHCHLSICSHFGWIWQIEIEIQKQIQITILWWDKQAWIYIRTQFQWWPIPLTVKKTSKIWKYQFCCCNATTESSFRIYQHAVKSPLQS